MSYDVTIVITPRDRYSMLAQCICEIYKHTDSNLFELVILNLGYPVADWNAALEALEGKTNYRIFDYGRIIPMEAMRRVQNELSSKYSIFMDNDSKPLPGWLPPLIDTADTREAAVVYPVTLERSGVDAGAEVRNHLFSTEIRVVNVDDTPYLIEYKTFRRSAPHELPNKTTETQAFELHCVMFNTKVFKSIELPSMTIREHLDIGMQLKARGLKLFVEPKSQILFDNLGTRANLSDLRYFNLRWNSRITYRSSRLFEKRWGYKFYSEQAIYNWALRRKLFLIMRWLYIPIPLANTVDRIVFGLRRRLAPVWDPLDDPLEESSMLSEFDSKEAPRQLDHSLN